VPMLVRWCRPTGLPVSIFSCMRLTQAVHAAHRTRITNRQKLLTFYCLLPFILTLRPGLIMPQTSDDSLLATRPWSSAKIPLQLSTVAGLVAK